MKPIPFPDKDDYDTVGDWEDACDEWHKARDKADADAEARAENYRLERAEQMRMEREDARHET